MKTSTRIMFCTHSVFCMLWKIYGDGFAGESSDKINNNLRAHGGSKLYCEIVECVLLLLCVVLCTCVSLRFTGCIHIHMLCTCLVSIVWHKLRSSYKYVIRNHVIQINACTTEKYNKRNAICSTGHSWVKQKLKCSESIRFWSQTKCR